MSFSSPLVYLSTMLIFHQFSLCYLVSSAEGAAWSKRYQGLIDDSKYLLEDNLLRSQLRSLSNQSTTKGIVMRSSHSDFVPFSKPMPFKSVEALLRKYRDYNYYFSQKSITGG